MAAYLLKRFAVSLLLLWLVLTASFFLIRWAPGGPLALFENPFVSSEQLNHLRHVYGLDRPLLEQYLSWMGQLVLEGNWGNSFQYHRPTLDVLFEAVPYSFMLAVCTLVLQYGVGTLLGVFAARRSGQVVDHVVRVLSLVFYSVPMFWLALMAILLFHLHWGLLPASGAASVGAESLPWMSRVLDHLRHLVLPAMVLGLTASGAVARFVRNSLLEAMNQDFVRTARAKGLSERRVLWMHGVRNSLVPLIQLLGVSVPKLLNGVLMVEVVFSWPGLGRVMFNAGLGRDYPLIMAGTIFSASLVILSNLAADLLHSLADPRVRHGS